jgi:RNAse (barnase) inhibitor barstar
MKNEHFLLAKSSAELSKEFKNSKLATVDGSKSATLRDFYDAIGEALEFPEYYSANLDSLDEMLNDLEWIEDEQVVLWIPNSDNWLIKEKSEEKIVAVVDLLDAAAEEWKWIEDDDEDRDKKDLRIVLEDTPRIRQLLENQYIPFGTL